MRGVGQLVRQRRRRVNGSNDRPVAGHVVLTFRVFPEDGHFVADCTELEVSSFGPTEEKALHAGIDAVMVYLNTLTEIGDVGRVFAERDIKVHPGPGPDAEDLTPRHIELHARESAAVRVLEVPANVVGVG